MNLNRGFWITGMVLAVSVCPVVYADQLTPKAAPAGLVNNSPGSIPSYTLTWQTGSIVLGIVGDFWTNSKIGSTWKVTGPSASQLAQAKVGINKLLQPFKLVGLPPVLQKPLVSLALSIGGWKVFKNVPTPTPVVKVPEASAFSLLGLNLAALLGLMFVFRGRLVRLS